MTDTSEIPDSPPRKRRRFQFSVATLLVFTAFCAFVFRFPQYVAAWVGLLLGVVFVLGLFVVIFYMPMRLVMTRLDQSQEADKTEDELQIDTWTRRDEEE